MLCDAKSFQYKALLFNTEASDLGLPAGVAPAAVELQVEQKHPVFEHFPRPLTSSQILYFQREAVHRDIEGDITHWEFVNKEGPHVIRLWIFND